MDLRKYLSLALLSSILFLFASCGMPTYYRFNYEISVENNGRVTIDGTEYDGSISLTLDNIDGRLDKIDSNSPSILVTYSLGPSDAASSLVNRFNSIIQNSSNHYNGTNPSFTSSSNLSGVESTVDGAAVHLYGMVDEEGNSLFTAPLYTFGPLDYNKSASGNSMSRTYLFCFDFVYDDTGNGYHFIMDVYEHVDGDYVPVDLDGNSETVDNSVILYRPMADSSFPSSISTGVESGAADFEYYINNNLEISESQYQINVFLTCVVRPGTESPFNNIYWASPARFSITV